MPELRRNPVSPDSPYAVISEREADGNGATADVTTIFLTASECPIGCSMCDLWQNTLEHPTPAGAIVTQIDTALSQKQVQDQNRSQWIKLYNSGNFFDPQSIPPSDYQSIAQRCAAYDRVVVENHPKFGRKRTLEFDRMISGKLEIAVGLETVQPRWLARLNKQMSRDEFDQYAHWLSTESIDLRVFLIVGVPGVSAREAIRWCRLSIRHALRSGARHISLIPARMGNGWGGRHGKLPHISVAEYAGLQESGIADTEARAVVTVDLWDIDKKTVTDAEQILLSKIAAANLSQEVG